jgi:hypothetical protein
LINYKSEEVELFSGIPDDIVGLDLENVESDGLGKGSALSRNHDVAFLDGEAGRGVARDVLVSFLETFVFGHVVQVVSPDDAGLVHLGRNNHPPAIMIISVFYFTILPRIETFPVNGHFLSM